MKLDRGAALAVFAARHRRPIDLEPDEDAYQALRGVAVEGLDSTLRAGLGDAAVMSARLTDVDPLRVPAFADLAEALSQQGVPLPDGRLREGLDTLDAEGVRPCRFAVDEPIAQASDLAPHVERGRSYWLADRAGLDEAATESLLDRAPALRDLDGAALRALTDEEIITPGEEHRLRLVLGIAAAVDHDPGLISAVLHRGVAAVRDLARLQVGDWVEMLASAEEPHPEGAADGALALRLARRMDACYPTDALVAHLSRSLEQLPAETPEDYAVRLARRFPGEGTGSAAVPGRDFAGARLDALSAVIAANEDIELLGLDYSAGSHDVEDLIADDLQKEALRATMPTLQRVRHLTNGADEALRLLGAGYTCATQVATDGVDRVRDVTGLAENDAKSVVLAATPQAQAVVAAMGAAFDATHGSSALSRTPAAAHDEGDYPAEMAGFEEVFGSHAGCMCEDWQSILGPAAYFVDLMHFVETNVAVTDAAGAVEEDHPLQLRIRRPDLWDLPLNREAAQEQVPVAQVALEVLERHLSTRIKGDPYTSLAQVDRVRSFRQPFHLPLTRVNAYLAKLGSSRLGITRVFRDAPGAIAAAGLGLADEALPLLTEPTPLDSPVRTSLVDLYDRKSHTITVAVTATPPRPVDVVALLQASALTRVELGELLEASFVKQAAPDLTISLERTNASSYQPDIERVHGLTADALDRIHRLHRLVRALSPWDARGVDIVLESLGGELSAQALRDLVEAREIATRFGLRPEEACVLWGEVPTRASSPGARSPFDARFNPPGLPTWHADRVDLDPTDLVRLRAGLGVDEAELDTLVDFLDIPRPTAGPWTLTRPSLSALLRHAELSRLLDTPVDDLPELFALAGLAGPVRSQAGLLHLLRFHDRLSSTEFSLAGLRDPRGRAEALAPALLDELRSDPRLNIPRTALHDRGLADQLIDALTRTPPNAPFATQVTDRSPVALRLGPDHQPWRTLPFPMPSNSPERGLRDLITAADPAQVLLGLLAVRLQTPPEDLSRAVHHVAEVLTAHLDGPISDADAPLWELERTGFTAEKAAQLLANPRPIALSRVEKILLDSLANAARRLAVWKLACTLDHRPGDNEPVLPGIEETDPLGVFLATMDRETGLMTFARQVHLRQPQVLLEFLTHLLATMAALSDASFTAETRRFAIDHPAILDLANPATVVTYAALRADVLGAGTLAPDRRELLHRSLAGTDPTDVTAALVRLFGAPVGTVSTLLRGRSLPLGLDAVRLVADGIRIAHALGVDGDTLLHAAATGAAREGHESSEYSELAQAAAALAAALPARDRTAPAWGEEVRAVEAAMVTARRDALIDVLVHSADFPEFDETADLQPYFLLDVDTDPCVQMPRLVLATTTIQRYVQRCILGLESSKDATARTRLASPDALDEWEWRSKYRVWQAARSVYLHPHKYLDPAVRLTKSPLFAEVESQLLQSRGDETAITDAFAHYIAGLDELARLDYVALFHETANGNDTLHFIGANPAETGRYFYRRARGLTSSIGGGTWSAWQQIDSAITATPTIAIIKGRPHVFWTDISTKPHAQLKGGSSDFDGYRHELRTAVIRLRADGSWTSPRQLSLVGSDSVLIDDFLTKFRTPSLTPGMNGDKADVDSALAKWKHPADEAIDTYALDGLAVRGPILLPGLPARMYWVYSRLGVVQSKTTGEGPVSVTGDQLSHGGRHVESLIEGRVETIGLKLTAGTSYLLVAKKDWLEGCLGEEFAQSFLPTSGSISFPIAYRALTSDSPARLSSVTVNSNEAGDAACAFFFPRLTVKGVLGGLETFTDLDLYTPRPVALGGADGSWLPSVFYVGGLQFLAHRGHWQEPLHGLDIPNLYLRCLSSEFILDLRNALFEGDLADVLDSGGDVSMPEEDWPFDIAPRMTREEARGAPIDGPMAAYVWELFFHIPVLVARHLGALRRYAEARDWYHHVLDPATSDLWKFGRFTRDSARTTLKEILAGESSSGIDAWLADPFDPHAIATVRVSAYQKAVYLAYVENLLDWADDLFTRYTPESVSEASLLYRMAGDLLGERPTALASCDPGGESPTYARISEQNRPWQQFVLEYQAGLETKMIGAAMVRLAQPGRGAGAELIRAPVFAGSTAATESSLGAGEHRVGNWAMNRMTARAMGQAGRTSTGSMPEPGLVGGTAGREGARIGLRGSEPGVLGTLQRMSAGQHVRFATDLWSQAASRRGTPSQATGADGPAAATSEKAPVFFVPWDDQLTTLWDRLEIRLGNLRSGQDINGARRDLAAYEPPIDPALIIAQRAAGMSLSEALASVLDGATPPPHRFSVMLGKAQAAAAAAASLGTALQRALESRDTEGLARLRQEHETNLLKLNRSIRQDEVTAAQAALDSAKEDRAVTQKRWDQFDTLINQGDTSWEKTESNAQSVSMLIEQGLPALTLVGAALGLVPNAGAPTAITFGGVQLSKAATQGESFLKAISTISSMVATNAGSEARRHRRDQGWAHQREIAAAELIQRQKNIDAAQARLDSAVRSKTVHDTAIKQGQEVLDYFGEKFSTLAHYRWTVDRLGVLYREAHANALSLARQAATAYAFERGVQPPKIGEAQWNEARSGLLSAEALQSDLTRMEIQFLETDTRLLEVEQHFSLAQINPAQLGDLRSIGECTFTLPEVYFDVAYPGQYLRRIKTVRLSVPCVVGPYTNVSAMLTLDWRAGGIVASDGTTTSGAQPVTMSIATSSGQRDAGLFELSFRDDRYLPFEGAAAVDSSWTLRLPKAFRSFDYGTISDVIVHVSYTARYDPTLRAKKEGETTGSVNALRKWLESGQPLVRVLSVRRDFPDQWAKVIPGQAATLTCSVRAEHFPLLVHSLLGELRASATCQGPSGAGCGIVTPPAAASPTMHPPILGTYTIALDKSDAPGLADVLLEITAGLQASPGG